MVSDRQACLDYVARVGTVYDMYVTRFISIVMTDIKASPQGHVAYAMDTVCRSPPRLAAPPQLITSPSLELEPWFTPFTSVYSLIALSNKRLATGFMLMLALACKLTG